MRTLVGMRGRGIEHASHQLSRTDTARRTDTRYACAYAQVARIGNLDMFVITNRKVNDSSTGLDQRSKTRKEKSGSKSHPSQGAKNKNLALDTVVLYHADTKNAGYPNWVEEISHNRRVFITINENDFALRLSRIKPGDAQRARLGHYIKRLDSRIAHYINLTDASWVQESHSPFCDPASKNEKLKTFFRDAFTGEPAEEALRFRAEGNWYEVPR